MWNRRQFFVILSPAVLSTVLVSAGGCNYKGEDAAGAPEKDFATSSTMKSPIGAAGSTFIAPLMNHWIATYQQMHPN